MDKILHPSFWEIVKWQPPWDVIVVGGGITGLSTSIHIKKSRPNASVLLIEALPEGNVASTKNAGFACFGSIGELRDDLKVLGAEQVKELLKYRYEGLHLLKETINPSTFDYQPCGGFELFQQDDPSFDENLNSVEDMNELVNDALALTSTFCIKEHTITSNTLHSKGIYNQYEGALNPAKMMEALNAKAIGLGVKLLKGCKVVEINKSRHELVLSNYLKIGYQQLALCTNGMIQSFLPDLDVTVAPNMVGYAKIEKNTNWLSCYHMDQGYTYFRKATEDYVIIGGGRHTLSDKLMDNEAADERIMAFLTQRLSSLLGNTPVKMEGFWKGYLGVGSQRLPLMKSLGQDIYCGVRLGGMGVAIGSYLGRSLAHLMKV